MAIYASYRRGPDKSDLKNKNRRPEMLHYGIANQTELFRLSRRRKFGIIFDRRQIGKLAPNDCCRLNKLELRPKFSRRRESDLFFKSIMW